MPEQFYRLTPAELAELLEGYEWRADQRLADYALIVAHLVQPHTKKRITPHGLYKRWTSAAKDRPAPAKAQDFKALWRKLQMQKAEEAARVKAEGKKRRKDGGRRNAS